jgi:PHO85 cyclin-6/7
MVEVLHHFPYTMIGADKHDPSHQNPHGSNLLRLSRSETSSSSTIRAAPSTDVSMTDVMSTHARSIPHPSAVRQLSQTATRESAYHNAVSSDLGNFIHPDPHHGANLSVRESPVHASALPFASQVALSSGASSVQDSPLRSAHTQSPIPSPPSPPRIKVKSLSHIQSFVIDDQNPLSPSRVSSRVSTIGRRDISPQYEISEMPVAEIIEMVAGLLTKITTTNDRQHEYLHRQMPGDGTHGLSQQTTSVLAFHGKNVPSISILSYLSRIHKYCPTTYEVFLSLLVYFDRMTERVNSGPMLSLRQANQQSLDRHTAPTGERSVLSSSPNNTHNMLVAQTHSTPPHSGSLAPEVQNAPASKAEAPPSPPLPTYNPLENETTNLSHFFVVDSFNIHRLVIAGVTCASKFFSDVFYTNSRYAKVSFTNLQSVCSLTFRIGWRPPTR